MYKRVGKPVIFFTVIIIAALTCLTYFGWVGTSGDQRNVYIAGARDIRFGIDIRGGVDVTFKPATTAAITTAQMNSARTKIETRLDNLNITDREIFVDPNNHTINVRFPWKSDEKNFDPESAIKELGSMAQLVFKSDEYNGGADIITGKDVKSAAVGTDSSNGNAYVVNITLNSSGIAKFDAATKALAALQTADSTKGQLYIYMDNVQIEKAGVLNEIANGDTQISGGFTATSAQQLADKINAGALPFALTTDNYSTISPTLGANALTVMLLAGLVAFILICLFMITYYRLPGFIACIALVGHVAGTILAISWPAFTLTLPGMAGIILSIGMGVDCNIITFERIKEELRNGKTLDGAIDSGFQRSFSAIFDGNVTVLIVGIILWAMGSASVRSFGYTLFWGVIFNFVMGIIASRIMLVSVSKFPAARKIALYSGRIEK